MNPKHFRKELESSITKQFEDVRMLDHYLDGGEGKRIDGAFAGNFQKTNGLPFRDENGFWYFVMGHSRYGEDDRVGP